MTDEPDLRDTVQHSRPRAEVPAVPGYRVLEELHRGGQGVVFKAVQLATRRIVALKLLRGGPTAGQDQLERFRREVDLIASLQHPGIVTIHDSGVASGVPWLAMEYVRGTDLRTHVRERALDLRSTLALFEKVAAAVSHAHQRGVIHRDLKPANILVDLEGRPHVLDFGLAKAAGRVGDLPLTMSGEFMGTLAYASPEQATGDPSLVDVRSDVYSLGVVLYELLVGDMPYQVTGDLGSILRHVAETEARSPSKSNPRIDDEVETILLKALAKSRERRYQSADALRADLERYLAGEPIEAKRDSVWYVLSKTLRRHRARVALLGVLALVLVASAVLSTGLAIRLKQQRDRALRAETQSARLAESAMAHSYRAALAGAQAAVESHDAATAQELLDSAPVDFRGWEWRHLRLQADSSIATIDGHGTPIVDAVFSPDGRSAWWLARPYDGIWEVDLAPDGSPAPGASPRISWKIEGESVLAFSADRSRVVTVQPVLSRVATMTNAGLLDSVVAFESEPINPATCTLSSWDRASSRRLARNEWSDCGAWYHSKAGAVVRSPVLTREDDWIHVLDAEGRRVLRLGGRHPQPLRARFSPDGGFVAAWSWQGELRAFDSTRLVDLVSTSLDGLTPLASIADVVWLPTSDAVTALAWDGSLTQLAPGVGSEPPASVGLGGPQLRAAAHSLAIMPSARALAPSVFIGTEDGRVATLELGGSSGLEMTPGASELVASARSHRGPVSVLAVSGDGRWLASGGDDGAIVIWDLRDRRVHGQHLGHRTGITSLAFNADGSRLLSGSRDGTLRTWNVATTSPLRLKSRDGTTHAGEGGFSPDGETFCSVSGFGLPACWRLGSSPLEIEVERASAAPAWTSSLAVLEGGGSPSLRVATNVGWTELRLSTASETELPVWREVRSRVHDQREALAVMPSGSLLVRSPEAVSLVDRRSDEVITCEDSAGLTLTAMSDDGEIVIGLKEPDLITSWDAATGRLRWRHRVAEDLGEMKSLAARGSSGHVALLSAERSVLLGVETEGLKVLHEFAGFAVAWSPDGARLATSSSGNYLELLDARSLDVLVRLPTDSPVSRLYWAPDGSRLAALLSGRALVFDSVRR